MTCPHCGYMGRAIKGLKPRPSRKPAWTCPACFGEVTYHRRDEEEEVKYDGAEERDYLDVSDWH